MKAFDGFVSEPKNRKPAQLPAGLYIAQILAVKIQGVEPDQTLILRLDIAEGEWKGYYTRRFQRESENSRSQYPAKYKGDYRLRIPNLDNKRAMYPESDLANFKDAIYKIEQSNPGYHWDWNESGLVGLLIGVNVQQGTYNGFDFTRIGQLEIVDEVKTGKAKAMAPLAPRSDASYDPPVDQQTGYVQVDTDQVPF